jgi:hypothetical protein
VSGAVSWPDRDVPAVCFACILLASKAESVRCRLDVLMKYVQQLRKVLPPYGQDAAAQALGHVPTRHDILKYEHSVLQSLQNTSCVALETHTGSVVHALFGKADVPPDMRLAVLNFFNNRAYTDSDLCLQKDMCLQKDREAVIVAAIMYIAEVAAHLGPPGQWQPPDDLCDR